jgi:hypothetical protein
MQKIHEGRKVDEFIIYYEDGDGESEGYEVYGVKQLKSALKWLHSDEVNATRISVYKKGKNFDNDSDDVIDYYYWTESKKSARKSIKESSYFDLVKAKEEGYNDYKHQNVGNPYKKGIDLYNAYWFGVERAENESSGKTHTTFSDEEFDSIFGGKMCRKSIKESENFVNYIAVYDEDSNCRGYIQNESPKLTQDVGKALHFKNENEANTFRAKLIKRGSFNGDELYVEGMYLNESKKSVRKSIKESRQSILDKRFYELVDEGYIYDEDEDGMNMSYGELVAVSDDLWETLEDELKYYDDFQEAYDVYMEIMDNTSDDAKMFMTGSDEYFYFEADEDEGTYSVDGEVPFVLEKLFKKFQKETDLVRR